MGVQSTNIIAKQKYLQAFHTNPVGGSTPSFTVPAGVSKLKLSAVAPGGCLASSATSQGISSAANNVFFARLNNVDPTLIGFANSSSTYFSAGYFGKYCYGNVVNGAVTGINGVNDISNAGRMNGNYFNALDAIPWGIVVSNSTATTQSIGTTTDGFNFTFTSVTTSASPILRSCVFGGNGQAMIVLGSTSGGCVFYTNNYGTTWITLSNFATAITRVRYLNGTWFGMLGTTLYYTTNPVNASNVSIAWTSSSVQANSMADIGWTGTTYVLPISNATNVFITSTLSGAFTLQAHGGDLAFDSCESGNGEVLLYKKYQNTTSATSIRGTSGAATTYVSVNLYGSLTSENIAYDAVKYMPFTSGGMWVMVGGSGANAYTTTSVVTSPALTTTAITTAIAGNTNLTNTIINTIQYLGYNYCHLGSSNGLGKYLSASSIVAGYATATQLTAEFGYYSNTASSPSTTIYKNNLAVLSLQGGNHANNGAISVGNSGNGGGTPHFPAITGMPGIGATGKGSIGSTTAGINMTPKGNGGDAYAVTTSLGGGGTYRYGSILYPPLPNSRIPGASGAGKGAGLSGGGGSLFSDAGHGLQTTPTFSDPASVFGGSSRIGSPGAGANGITYLTSSDSGAAGGGEGCYQWEISVTTGDIITLDLPSANYIYANGATGTNGGLGGESYAIIEWEI